MGAPGLQPALRHSSGRTIKGEATEASGLYTGQCQGFGNGPFEIATNGVLWGTVSVEQGIKYIVDGNLHTTTGRKVPFRTVWIVEQDTPPRLVTAYSLK